MLCIALSEGHHMGAFCLPLSATSNFHKHRLRVSDSPNPPSQFMPSFSRMRHRPLETASTEAEPRLPRNELLISPSSRPPRFSIPSEWNPCSLDLNQALIRRASSAENQCVLPSVLHFPGCWKSPQSVQQSPYKTALSAAFPSPQTQAIATHLQPRLAVPDERQNRASSPCRHGRGNQRPGGNRWPA